LTRAQRLEQRNAKKEILQNGEVAEAGISCGSSGEMEVSAQVNSKTGEAVTECTDCEVPGELIDIVESARCVLHEVVADCIYGSDSDDDEILLNDISLLVSHPHTPYEALILFQFPPCTLVFASPPPPTSMSFFPHPALFITVFIDTEATIPVMTMLHTTIHQKDNIRRSFVCYPYALLYCCFHYAQIAEPHHD
jgi:hypothetical protein